MLARVRTPSSLVRKRERKRQREKERERKKERDVIELISLLLTMAELLFLPLKGMMGALAPFSYLVIKVLLT
jgi:hypothetical protein